MLWPPFNKNSAVGVLKERKKVVGILYLQFSLIQADPAYLISTKACLTC